MSRPTYTPKRVGSVSEGISVRFYLPDWDDNVDAEYDFDHDENSRLRKAERPLDYIWGFYGREQTPIDGILISREQVEDTITKRERLREHGVYDNPEPAGGIAEWLPVISDCGAFGYRRLPEPPYGNEEMLEFYEDLRVSIGVTIDHLIIDNTPTSRLYLDERALPDGFSKSDLPGGFGRSSAGPDVMVEKWRTDDEPNSFDPSKYDTVSAMRDALADDPRAVYVEDDRQYRYDLTLKNAREMRDVYDRLEKPNFRLMAAIQGWSPETYADAAERVLEMGYDYIGIGGLAMANAETVESVVRAVGEVISKHQEQNDTRVDCHVFGFAKQDVFEEIGASGVSSFDSASMLRASWTGGDNYHLSKDRQYYGIRVHPATPQRGLRESIALELRGQEVLHALRAYGDRESIIEAIEEWQSRSRETLNELPQYLERHRHDPIFDESALTDVRQALRDDFRNGRELQAAFGNLRRETARLLREDSVDDPIPFDRYEELIQIAREESDAWYPGYVPLVERVTNQYDSWQGAMFSGDKEENLRLEQMFQILRSYTEWYDDTYDDDEIEYLSEYRRTLEDRPWEECECPICQEMGMDVVFFRRNNRNRRRGFHNIYRFYQEFTDSLPKTLVATVGNAKLSKYTRVEDYLRNEHPGFWANTHDLPVCEVGVLSAEGIHEWWERPPTRVSYARDEMASEVAEKTSRYQHLFVAESLSRNVREQVEQSGCEVHELDSEESLSTVVLDTFEFDIDQPQLITPSDAHES